MAQGRLGEEGAKGEENGAKDGEEDKVQARHATEESRDRRQDGIPDPELLGGEKDVGQDVTVDEGWLDALLRVRSRTRSLLKKDARQHAVAVKLPHVRVSRWASNGREVWQGKAHPMICRSVARTVLQFCESGLASVPNVHPAWRSRGQLLLQRETGEGSTHPPTSSSGMSPVHSHRSKMRSSRIGVKLPVLYGCGLVAPPMTGPELFSSVIGGSGGPVQVRKSLQELLVGEARRRPSSSRCEKRKS